MSIKKDLTGKKFGRLLVISQAPSIARKNSNRKQIWNCAWNCLCDCGNTRIATTDKLNRGNIQSCGCLALENSKNPVMLSKLHESNREYHPRIASARRVLERYVRQDNGQCNIEFDEFYSISQMNCTYCGIEPSNKFNAFYDQPDNSYSKLEGTFCYSGLDRIDSSFPHISGNCVASCLICNVAKSDYTTKEFLSWASRLQIKTFQPINIPSITIPFPKDNTYLMTTIRVIFTRYNDGDLTEEEFYSLSQQNCFYCDCSPNNSNRYSHAIHDNRMKKSSQDISWLNYNGVDRISSELPHNKLNVVSSCIKCNWAKLHLSFDNFMRWIQRIQTFQGWK